MIIDGKAIAYQIQEETKKEISLHKNKRTPTLAVILVGDDPASQIYVNKKEKECSNVGIDSLDCHLAKDVTEIELLEKIQEYNLNSDIDGILVQLPLPKHISAEKIIESILPEKDVDGFHPVNMGKALIGNQTGFLPCTPYAIKEILSRSKIEIEGKHVVIVGRSNIVGKPTAAILMQKAPQCNASVTIVHSLTKNLQEICRSADILIGAIGKPNFISKEMIKEGAVIIDVGINRVKDSSAKKGYRLTGDVNFEDAKKKCSYITPVPGGVGPVTIAMLLHNTLLSFQRRENIS